MPFGVTANEVRGVRNAHVSHLSAAGPDVVVGWRLGRVTSKATTHMHACCSRGERANVHPTIRLSCHLRLCARSEGQRSLEPLRSGRPSFATNRFVCEWTLKGHDQCSSRAQALSLNKSRSMARSFSLSLSFLIRLSNSFFTSPSFSRSFAPHTPSLRRQVKSQFRSSKYSR